MAILAFLLVSSAVHRERPLDRIIPRVTRLEAPRFRTATGGGSDRSALPPRKGRLPERTRQRVFVLPMIERVEQPRLPLQQAMLEAPAFNIDAAQTGDPLGRGNLPSGGFSGLLGIGIGPGRGTGAGDGPGGPGGFRAGPAPRITRGPKVIYQEEPEYSDQARKARFQGVVLLSIEIGIDGRASNIRVIRGAGLGLDERAVEAVSRWRFQPAVSGDHAIAVSAMVEVGFHLL
jgi:protein TonB